MRRKTGNDAERNREYGQVGRCTRRNERKGAGQ